MVQRRVRREKIVSMTTARRPHAGWDLELASVTHLAVFLAVFDSLDLAAAPIAGPGEGGGCREMGSYTALTASR